MASAFRRTIAGSLLACSAIMITRNPGHLRTFDYRGLYRYFLTFCTNERQRIFEDHTAVDIATEQILRAAEHEQFADLAHCFMPDHLHLLVEGLSDAADCLRFIKRAKQCSGFHYSKAFGGKLWQRYGFERVLRNDEQSLAVAKYILENPVRAGLVTRPEDYPFLGSQTYPVSEILEAIGDWEAKPRTRSA